MFPVRDKWYDIGLHIGLTCGDLDIIKAQYRDDFKDCLREMLKLRLSRAKPLNVAGIVLALQKTGAEDIAVQFKEKHCHSLIEGQNHAYTLNTYPAMGQYILAADLAMS